MDRIQLNLFGNITLEVDIGDNRTTRHTFGVLHDNTKTRILGRDLLKKFGSTEFNWDSHRVRLGMVWNDTRAVLEGGDALSRSAVAALECHHDSRGQGGKSATGDYGRGHSDYAPDVWPGHISGANGQDPMRNETRPFIRGRYPSSLSRTGLSYQQCRKVLMRLREFSCVPTKLGYDISTHNLWDI